MKNGNGWRNGKTYYGIKLPLGDYDKGGPLFFEQYTYMGIDPNGLRDDNNINYAEQTKNHSLINRAYCIENPKKFKGYAANCWGLTAGDSFKGYVAHCPEDDRVLFNPRRHYHRSLIRLNIPCRRSSIFIMTWATSFGANTALPMDLAKRTTGTPKHTWQLTRDPL